MAISLATNATNATRPSQPSWPMWLKNFQTKQGLEFSHGFICLYGVRGFRKNGFAVSPNSATSCDFAFFDIQSHTSCIRLFRIAMAKLFARSISFLKNSLPIATIVPLYAERGVKWI